MHDAALLIIFLCMYITCNCTCLISSIIISKPQVFCLSYMISLPVIVLLFYFNLQTDMTIQATVHLVVSQVRQIHMQISRQCTSVYRQSMVWAKKIWYSMVNRLEADPHYTWLHVFLGYVAWCSIVPFYRAFVSFVKSISLCALIFTRLAISSGFNSQVCTYARN